eukprot:scaffold259472_cov36-Tisochrysis_lutea.AAC.1
MLDLIRFPAASAVRSKEEDVVLATRAIPVRVLLSQVAGDVGEELIRVPQIACHLHWHDGHEEEGRLLGVFDDARMVAQQCLHEHEVGVVLPAPQHVALIHILKRDVSWERVDVDGHAPATKGHGRRHACRRRDGRLQPRRPVRQGTVGARPFKVAQTETTDATAVTGAVVPVETRRTKLGRAERESLLDALTRSSGVARVADAAGHAWLLVLHRVFCACVVRAVGIRAEARAPRGAAVRTVPVRQRRTTQDGNGAT